MSRPRLDCIGLVHTSLLLCASANCGDDDSIDSDTGGTTASFGSSTTTATDAGNDGGPSTADGSSTTGGSTSGTGSVAPSDSTGTETGESCPYAPGQIDCTLVCQARQDYCEACVDGPCPAFDVFRDLADCIAICTSIHASPDVDALQLEADGCFMLTAGGCDWNECFLAASC